MPNRLKPLILAALGIFLLTRLANGSLLFYINQRFAVLTLLASLGLLLVAAGYLYQPGHAHQHAHDGQHLEPSWAGLAFLLVPLLLGVLVPPRPLGAEALANRSSGTDRSSALALPNNGSVVLRTSPDKNILYWLSLFQGNHDPAAFAGQQATVIGFVYRDGRFGSDMFSASRFLVSCCVADATAVGLLVRWSQADRLPKDQWIEVSGQFQPGNFGGQTVPILMATSIKPVAVPGQPYLYP